ncbi:hypothetical protein PHSY_003276 [Pseudozyma hubeiensis SY62]|uniref:Postreplication repair E3 ubiquitin-protein ligase RAD18 n=1 Tax=Pseudozyma hubeiensis (strain SY62) TaxID=1305764 RepID=R9PC94_PSEHS|nr:hypothetical protein PHSY_003276 [Pseudozyma hubeiensis SY62]GAC95700.1 hypothetical protein PHSY_003276 [Pseudozyma hubeiensis SY62]
MQSSVATLMDDVTDPSDWKDGFALLRNLDASLRCDLCFDIYTSPVSIKSCHHTFCSTCIRTHINQSGNSGSFCPKCRQTKAYDSELIPQPVLEVTALEWKRSRSFLARLQSEQKARQISSPPPIASSSKRAQLDHVVVDDGASSPSAASPPRRSKRIKTDVSTSAVEQNTGSRSSPLTIPDDDDDFIHATDDDKDDNERDDDYVDAAASARASPSKRRSHSAREDPPPKSSDRELKADDLVQCPICSHKFTVSALNRHLDSASCYPGFPEPSPEERGLASKPAKPASSWFTKPSITSSSSLSTTIAGSDTANEKRLHRPQYNLKSDRDLRKLLDDAGLPTSGDREKLVERHRQWINLWNANLDSTKARRSAGQLRRELAAWERTKSSAKDHSAVVDRQKGSWVKSNKSHFDELIAKARAGVEKDRRLREAPDDGAERNAVDESEDQRPNVIIDSPAVKDVAEEPAVEPQVLESES